MPRLFPSKFRPFRWILPLSHDEVVSGKGSLLDKCGYLGTPFEERIRTLKTLYGFQVGMPGRPLIFMGGEIGQGREWKDNRFASPLNYFLIGGGSRSDI